MALVTRVIDTGELRTLQMHHITPESLTDEMAEIALDYIIHHYQGHGEIPTRAAVRDAIPQIEFDEIEGINVDVLCEAVAEELTEIGYRRLQLKSEELLLSEESTSAAASVLAKEFNKLSAQFGKTPLYSVGSNADTEFNRRTTNEELFPAAPFPWKTLQQATMGAHGGEVIVLFGLKKNGKTFALLEIGEYMAWKGYKVLFLSPAEMRKEVLTDRMHSIRGQFPYQEFRTKELFLGDSPAAAQNNMELLKVITSFNEANNFIIYDSGDDEAQLSMSAVEGIIEEVRPDVVLIDQMHYISMPGFKGFSELRHLLGAISKRLKKLASARDIPVIVTTQANSDKEIGESIQISQIVDMTIYVELHKKQRYRKFEVRDVRELELDDWYTAWEPCTDLGEIPYNDARIRKPKSEARTRRKTQGKLYDRS